MSSVGRSGGAPRPVTPAPRRAAVLVALALALSVVGLAAPVAAPSAADPGDIGWEGPSYAGASGSPSGSKPQSKLWFNDGLWWATLFDDVSGDFHIWRLDIATRSWVDTGTLVDIRTNSRSDALWTGQHLYIANHVFAETSSAGGPSQLRRYSYNSATKTYTADAGFPVTINNVRSETLVIDRESTGRLWATWVQSGQVMVAHTTTDDRTWAAPFPLPVATQVGSDDISSVIAFRSDRIGIMWSDQNDETMSFTTHLNSSPPGTWTAREIAYSGSNAADDHINLASVQDVGGRVLAAVKTSRSGSAVLNHLLDRNPTTGVWTSHTYGLGSDNHTRPIAVVDSGHQRVHMFATSGQSGGSIYEKSAPLSGIAFPAGKGTPVLTDASSTDINNATTTKQNVTSATGLVVVATNDSTRRYWTHYDPLGGSQPPGPSAPVASFTRSPASGAAPLEVSFTDTSTGSPTSWSWSFGDGGTSTERNPVHTYSSPGSYTVSLTATNATGSDTETQTGSVTVTSGEPPPTGTPVTFMAAADGYVQDGAPTKSYATQPTLRVRSSGPAYESYLRFDVAGLTSAPTSAKLRLFVTDASPVSGSVTRAATTWTEAGLTYNTRPATIGGVLGSLGATTVGTWVEVDVTAAVTGNGAVGFRLNSTSTNSTIFSSREDTNKPQLVVTAGSQPPGPSAPVASFTRSPASGAAPLEVSFTDTSSGSPTSWSWSFGDGGTSTEQNPVHTYSSPGSYTVSLTATNATGSDTETQTGSVTVSSDPPPPPPPPPPGTPVTFVTTADGLVQSGAPTRSYGTQTTLRVRSSGPVYESYLRFDVAGLTSAPTSAKLRVFVTDASPVGGSATEVGIGWTEGSLTYNTRPAALGGVLGTAGATTVGTWMEIDVTAAVDGNGAVAIRLTSTSTNSGIFTSREGANKPQLVVTP